MAAAGQLSEYTENGRRAILAELQRRREAGDLIDVDRHGVLETRNAIPTAFNVAESDSNLIARLWRGEVPLRRAYWIYGVLTNLLLNLALSIATETRSAPLVLLALSMTVGYQVLIYVAIWRSAGRYSGNPIWGDFARLSLVLGVVITVARLFVRR